MSCGREPAGEAAPRPPSQKPCRTTRQGHLALCLPRCGLAGHTPHIQAQHASLVCTRARGGILWICIFHRYPYIQNVCKNVCLMLGVKLVQPLWKTVSLCLFKAPYANILQPSQPSLGNIPKSNTCRCPPKDVCRNAVSDSDWLLSRQLIIIPENS